MAIVYFMKEAVVNHMVEGDFERAHVMVLFQTPVSFLAVYTVCADNILIKMESNQIFSWNVKNIYINK